MSSSKGTTYQACDNELLFESTFHSLPHDKEIDQQSDYLKHERMHLDKMDNEYCSIDKQNPAVYYCPACAAPFCYACYGIHHEQSDEKQNKPDNLREKNLPMMEENM